MNICGKSIVAALALAAGALPLRAQFVQNGGVTGTSLQVSTLTTGNTLSVEAAVSGDGRYVTMDLDPQFSTLDGIDTFVVPNTGTTVGGGGGGGGGLFIPGGTQALAIRRVPFRPAQIGPVVLVSNQDELLSAKVPALSLKGVSIKDAVKKIADVSKRNIVLGVKGLEEEGVNTSWPRDFEIPAGTVKSSLIALLLQGTGTLPMAITAEDRVICIYTQAQADTMVVTRRYYLEDLLANSSRWIPGGTDLNTVSSKFGFGPQSIDFSKPPAPAAGKLPKGYQPVSLQKSDAKSATKPADSMQASVSPGAKTPVSTNISELITSTVRPEIWKCNGGKFGDVGVIGHVVVVRAPISVQALLDGPKHYNPDKAPVYVGYGQ